jgi:hypothetical protein
MRSILLGFVLTMLISHASIIGKLITTLFYCPKKLVWAAAIVSLNLWALHLIITNNLLQQKGTANIASIPIRSNLFSTAQAAKKPVKSSLPNPDATIPTTSIPATPTYPPFIPFQLHYLLFTPLSPYAYHPYYHLQPNFFNLPPVMGQPKS